jgi:sigma-B regulation protein RsbU (phosphoserine phosphatase)
MATLASGVHKTARTLLPHRLLVAGALLFAAITSLHAFLWMYDVRRPGNPVEIGINAGHDTVYDHSTGSVPIYDVTPNSPAEVAGLKPGDRMMAINGRELTTFNPFEETWGQGLPGEMVQLDVMRPGEAHPMRFHVKFRESRQREVEGLAEQSAREVTNLYPVLFLLVGFTVLLFRVDDPVAWLLATLFACFIAVPEFPHLHLLWAPAATFVSLFHAVFGGMLSAAFYVFFAIFPRKSLLERKAPWLKWVAVVVGVLETLPGLAQPAMDRTSTVAQWLERPEATNIRNGLTYGFIGLGVVSLLLNSFGESASTDTKRKSRVILLGTLIGVVPVVAQRFVTAMTGYQPSFWLGTALVLLVLLYPLSFAYAVVKHRVLEIPALLRRSARYVLVQRGYFLAILVVALGVIYLFTHWFSGVFKGHSQVGMGLSAMFGVALVWVSGPIVKRGTQKIDQAFFRGSYDARKILEDLAGQLRNVTDRRELGTLLTERLQQALHPKTLVLYTEAANGILQVSSGSVPPQLVTLQPDAPYLKALAERGRAWDVPPKDSLLYPGYFPLEALAPECLVPLLARDSRLVGLCVLGEALSDEPYSREDKRLLDSVASQAAAALDNIRLAENIADRLEKDRSAEREMQIARDVQSRLFPRKKPPLATLEYAGECLQARQVGGDYFDYLDLGHSEVGFLLADISGKGIAGALLMANLQANFRSRSAEALTDLPGLLKSINELFYDNSPEDRYATMFFALYDDATRKMTYANCGHNPPMVFRTDGTIEKLKATASVVGLFVPWDVETQQCQLGPGDVLVIYTDGVTEAEDGEQKEFGENRLIETVGANCKETPEQLLKSIQTAVQKFQVGEQFDDLTLVVARVK